MQTTIGQLLVNQALPEDMRDYTRTLDKGGTQKLLQELADRYPDRYRDISHKLLNVGKDVAYERGSSISLSDLSTAKAKKMVIPALRARIKQIAEDPRLSRKQKDDLIVSETAKLLGKLDSAIFKEGEESGNRLVQWAVSGGRGNKSQINQMTGSPLMVMDHMNRPIPVPVLSSFSEGLDPVEMWATSYGVRKGYVDIKQCLAEDTEVLMADGSVKAIKDIKVGQMVMGADTSGNLFPSKVLDVFANGERQCWEYHFRVNRSKRFVSLTATEDHKVLARFKFGTRSQYSTLTPTPLPLRKAANCQNANKNPFVAETPRGYCNPAGFHEPLACVLGVLIGDGCTRGRTYELSCADPTLIEDLRPTLQAVGVDLTPPSSGYGWTLKYATYDKSRHDTRGANPVVELCKKYGLDKKLAHEKTLPADVWNWNDQSVCQLLAGIFATDGCIHISNSGCINIRLQLTSAAVVHAVARLLDLRLGIQTSGITVTPGDRQRLGKRDQYRVTVSYRPAVQKFFEMIKLPGKKGEELRRAIEGLPPGSARNALCGYKSFSKRAVGLVNTYDLHVDNRDHLFVLSNGLIVSNSTPKAGFFGKQLASAAHKLVVQPGRPLSGVGLPVDTDDADNEGAILARDYGPFKEGTVITPNVIKQLRKKNKRILVHSPIAAPIAGGGIPQWAVGIRENGMARIGDNVGIPAAQAISEPLAQAAISAKHVAGVAGASGGGSSLESQAGFETINRLANIPKHFEGKAPVAGMDGTISRVEPAPQGGQYVFIGDEKHYVSPGQGLSVKLGQKVEAGDVLSNGIPSPAEVVFHKGIGEGRRYFTNVLREVLGHSGVKSHRRNIELVSRSLLNHIRMTGDSGPQGVLPDDVIEYDDFAARYTPRQGALGVKTKLAKGKYLEQPALHYSIGTRITPRVMKELQEHDVSEIMVHDEEPEFVPEMQRAMDVMSQDKDWMTRMGGFYLEKNMLDAVHRGATSTVSNNTSYIPSLARGVDFGLGDKGKGKPY